MAAPTRKPSLTRETARAEKWKDLYMQMHEVAEDLLEYAVFMGCENARSRGQKIERINSRAWKMRSKGL